MMMVDLRNFSCIIGSVQPKLYHFQFAKSDSDAHPIVGIVTCSEKIR
jgi:hypothetical protein